MSQDQTPSWETEFDSLFPSDALTEEQLIMLYPSDPAERRARKILNQQSIDRLALMKHFIRKVERQAKAEAYEEMASESKKTSLSDVLETEGERAVVRGILKWALGRAKNYRSKDE